MERQTEDARAIARPAAGEARGGAAGAGIGHGRGLGAPGSGRGLRALGSARPLGLRAPGSARSRARSWLPRALALATALLAAGCVGAKPKPPEPGLGPAPVPATAASPGADADSLRIYLMTFGPGQDVWEHFGHTALWVHDPARHTDQAYNYGMFDFRQAHFYRRFIEGKMLYWMEGFDANMFADAYVRQDRSVWVQELALTPAQREALRAFLAWNELPDHKFYPYDYYRDGCATRVRDALDRVLGGRIYAQTRDLPSGTTYRSHSLQLVEDDPWTYTGLLLGLARPTDRPLSLWEEMFLPLKLQSTLRRVTVPTADGRTVPLVASERTIYASTRPDEPTTPPERTWMYLLLGAVVGLLLVGLAEATRRPDRATADGRSFVARGARAALTLVGGFWTLVNGAFGLLLVFLWTLTRHVTSYDNENVLQFNALSLVLLVLLPAAVYGRSWATRPARLLAGVIAALSLLGLLLKATPWFWQVNGPIIALALPANLGLAWAMWRVTGPVAARPGPVPAREKKAASPARSR